MRQNRNEKIDIMKSLGIISVVIGHALVYETGFKSDVRIIIYSYHMSLFLFCSGYLFKDSYLFSFPTFLKKRLFSLYLPFLGFGCFFVFLDILRQYTPTMLGNEIVNWVLFKPANSFSGPLWFVQWLFLSEIIFWCGKKIITYYQKTITASLVVSFFFVTVGVLLIKLKVNIYNIDISFLAFPVIFLGSVYKKYENNANKYFKCIAFVLSTILLLTFNKISGLEIDYAYRLFYGKFFYVITVIGLIFVVSFANVTVKLTWIRRYSYQLSLNSFWIMALHVFIFKCIDFAYYKVMRSNVSFDSDTVYRNPYAYSNLFILYVVAGILVPILFAKIYRTIIQLVRKRIRNIRIDNG